MQAESAAGIGRLPGQTTESFRTRTTDNPDALLVQKAQEGDVDAFERLVERYERTVYAIVARMIPSRDDAEDLAQEVFLQAWKSIRRFRGDAQFGTWLHTITVNATLKRIQWLKRRDALSLDDPELGLWEHVADDSGNGPLDVACSAEARQAVQKALAKLSDNHRMAVVLHYFEDYSCDEIAAMMQCSVGTVWSRLHYACKKLKADLGTFQASLAEQVET